MIVLSVLVAKVLMRKFWTLLPLVRALAITTDSTIVQEHLQLHYNRLHQLFHIYNLRMRSRFNNLSNAFQHLQGLAIINYTARNQDQLCC